MLALLWSVIRTRPTHYLEITHNTAHLITLNYRKKIFYWEHIAEVKSTTPSWYEGDLFDKMRQLSVWLTSHYQPANISQGSLIVCLPEDGRRLTPEVTALLVRNDITPFTITSHRLITKKTFSFSYTKLLSTPCLLLPARAPTLLRLRTTLSMWLTTILLSFFSTVFVSGALFALYYSEQATYQHVSNTPTKCDSQEIEFTPLNQNYQHESNLLAKLCCLGQKFPLFIHNAHNTPLSLTVSCESLSILKRSSTLISHLFSPSPLTTKPPLVCYSIPMRYLSTLQVQTNTV